MLKGKQTNICVNEARKLLFFEGQELAYNYRTGQWTAVPAYDGLGMYSLRGATGENATIGLVQFSGLNLDLSAPTTSDVPQEAVLTTGSTDPNPGGRSVVKGVRPLVNGGTYSVRVGSQDYLGDDIFWSPYESINSRTRMANFREEGRYLRTEITISGGFTAAQGADLEIEPQGRV